MAKHITCNVNPLFYVISVNEAIVVQYVSVAQVRNVITSLKDSSPGWDHLSQFVMNQCVDTYVEPILINNYILVLYPYVDTYVEPILINNSFSH